MQEGKALEDKMTNTLIAKYNLTELDATQKFKSRVKNHRILKLSIVPHDFNACDVLDNIGRIYAPVWFFHVSAESAWHGENSRTVTYTE